MPLARVQIGFAVLIRLPALLGSGIAVWGSLQSGKFAYLVFLPYFLILYSKNAACERQAAAAMRDAHVGTDESSWAKAQIVPRPSIVGPALVDLALVLLVMQE